jgi:hypothetical protein
LSALALSLGILIKLFNIIAAVPILVVIVDRFWEMRKKPILSYWADLQAIAAAILVGAIITLIVLAPFLHYFDQVTRQVVTFHIDAKNTISSPVTDSNIETLGRFFAMNVALIAAASIGLFIAILRRDRRIFPLAAWLLATLTLLMVHTPLFPRHTIVLIPPLIAVVVLALNYLPEISIRSRVPSQTNLPLTIAVLTIATVLVSIPSDYQSYRDLKARGEISVIDDLPKIASSKLLAELERSTTPDQWIITDAPYLAALANRSAPPWLVDPSIVRVSSGYLSTRELIEAGEDRRVHAVLFATDRLTAAPVAPFHDWVAKHFVPRYLEGLGSGVELWVR